MGRQEAARLLLALLSQRGDWIPRLMEGLRHREVRLGHLADRIDDLQGTYVCVYIYIYVCVCV